MLYKRVKEALRGAGIPTPELDARLILRKALGVEEARIYAHPEEEVAPSALARTQALLERRLKGEPMAYILGEKEFYSRPFIVNPHVLIPREETELLVDEALGIIKGFPNPTVADVGTGCGCIAITILLEHPGARVVAIDSSGKALGVARANANRLCSRDALRRLKFVEGELLRPLEDGTIDVVVSNPPYVSREEYELLPREVRDFEPREALFAGERGLECIVLIVGDAPRVLKRGGWLLVEIGAGQGGDVSAMFREVGFGEVEVLRDLSGKDRVVKGKWIR
jgi:release factor glutamine methyltransferase